MQITLKYINEMKFVNEYVPVGKTATWVSEAHPQQDSKQIRKTVKGFKAVFIYLF